MTAIKAAHRTKRQADSLGTVAFVLLWHGNTRDVGFNGANGRSGANGRDGRIWLIDRWLWLVLGIELQEAGN